MRYFWKLSESHCLIIGGKCKSKAKWLLYPAAWTSFSHIRSFPAATDKSCIDWFWYALCRFHGFLFLFLCLRSGEAAVNLVAKKQCNKMIRFNVSPHLGNAGKVRDLYLERWLMKLQSQGTVFSTLLEEKVIYGTLKVSVRNFIRGFGTGGMFS